MSNFYKRKNKLKNYGVGLGLRKEMFNDIISHKNEIDFVEIAPENYILREGKAKDRLNEVKKFLPIIPHGLNLSIGSVDAFDKSLLKNIKNLFKGINPPWFSDHLCFNYVDGIYIHDLIPLPFNKDVAIHVADRIKKIEDIFQIPFLIENPSYYLKYESDLSEEEFISLILEKADCGLLLDINNVYVNSKNHGYDPIQFLNGIPIERTIQVHIAGHFKKKEIIIDTHGEAIIDEVYNLLSYLLSKTTPKAILLERDFNFPNFNDLLLEVNKIRTLTKKKEALI